jgi:uncharacterized CHY-type Zn-finger protein
MIIYCTTNIINGKKYIGKDEKNNPLYLGSGIQLVRAVDKYGKENFKKQILEHCTNSEELSQSEQDWIDYFGAQKSDFFYNIAPGGRGGFTGVRFRSKQKKYICLHCKRECSKSNLSLWHNDNCKLNPNRTQESIEKIKNRNMKILQNRPSTPAWNKGKVNVYSEEALRKMSMKRKSAEKILCPHCNREIDYRNFSNWHGDKCKLKK